MGHLPDILAFDFDGVLCDGLPEYFHSSWLTYCQLWHPSLMVPPPELEAQFGRLRPVIETGWEMPLLIDALLEGISESEILQDWPGITAQRLGQYSEVGLITAATLAKTLDQVRDRAILKDRSAWLSLHRFYPEALACLRSQLTSSSATRPVIISTKEQRFILELLQQQGITLDPQQVYGKETQRPKHQILRELLSSNPQSRIWFIEDRLKTLSSIQRHPDLVGVSLYLALWGYNTPQERSQAEASLSVQVLSQHQIAQPLEIWPKLVPEIYVNSLVSLL